VSGLLEVFGGVGLFLVGMSLMTEGLKAIAGNAIRNALARFTKGPVTGAFTGAVTTGMVQSSSATTVMAVGFVGAGLMTFEQSLGIIFGANIGSTMTGWLVAIVGVKLSLGKIALPVVFIGALMRLLGRGSVTAIGSSIAGFGLLFLGITMLQTGMAGVGELITPSSFPPDTLWGRFRLLLIGIGITIVMQSSAAGVATTLTAIHAGHISLAQAASLVVGMDVGTTATALLATVGGNVNARRTGLAHVVFNLLTGFFAFLAIPYFLHVWSKFIPLALRNDPEIGLVSFHSLFNIVGVICILPLTSSFAKFIRWIVPFGSRSLERRLEPILLSDPRVALESVWATLEQIIQIIFSELKTLLRSRESSGIFIEALREAEQATLKTTEYLDRIRRRENDSVSEQRQVSAYHVLDHLSRLLVRASKEDRLRTVVRDRELFQMSEKLSVALEQVIEHGFTFDTAQSIESVWLELEHLAEPFRQEMIERTIRDGTTLEATFDRLDGIRWLRRIAYHAWRITFHMANATVAVKIKRSSQIMRQESDPIDE
jgi:phosphate:Na+ symporter